MRLGRVKLVGETRTELRTGGCCGSRNRCRRRLLAETLTPSDDAIISARAS